MLHYDFDWSILTRPQFVDLLVDGTLRIDERTQHVDGIEFIGANTAIDELVFAQLAGKAPAIASNTEYLAPIEVSFL